MILFQPDSYERIRSYAQKFVSRLGQKTGGHGLTGPSVDDDNFAVLMDKGDVARLLLNSKCHKLAAIIGIADDDGREQITISLLATDVNGHVLEQHRKPAKSNDPDRQLPGEEVWPVKVTIRELGTFLPPM